MPKAHPSARLAATLACTLAAVAPSVRGDITYWLGFDPASSGDAQQVANSVAVAAAFYNQHGSFNKHWTVYHDTSVATANGSYNGTMRYGGIRNERVAFHEAAHTFGMGTHWTYPGLIDGGTWKGQYGNIARAESFGGGALNGDGHAVWPSGFNYDDEDGFLNRHYHTRVMAGIRADMGILSFTREARNEAVVAGETAEFKVESPLAGTWQWKRNNVNLTNGGDISGANSPILRIANAEAADAGTYTCTVTGAGETLTNRPRQLWVHAAPQLAQLNFNGNATDSVGFNHGTATGSPAYVAGKISQAVDLDGADDFIDLPDPAGRAADLTVATWVNWDGGGDWQRVFDLGTGIHQYLFLTPKAGGGSMRLGFKDAINNRDVEYAVNTPTLATGQWVHLAAVLKGSSMTLYVNGKPVGSAFELPGNPAHFPATNNYIGKSQYNDPLFNGRVDDFRLYGKALGGSEIWSLWGQSANLAPVFSPTLITLPTASSLEPYTGQSLASFASDANSDTLTFAKLYGPAWLTVAANGTLSGQPGAGNGGLNTFIVRVTDPSGATSDATVEMQVFAPPSAPVTSSTTAPAIDADDVSFFAGNIGEPDTIGGTANADENDESTFLAENRTSKGQTFTTGSSPLGYFFQSFTFQHIQWPSVTPPNGANYDVQPGDQYEFQIGTISGTTKTPLVKYSAAYDGPAVTGGNTTGTGRYFTFNISGLGQQLAPNTTYYFEVAPLTGDPFFELNSSRTGTYAGGTAFRGNITGAVGAVANPLVGDFVFHANLEAKTAVPSSTVAYWDFEEGNADAYVPYPRATANQYEGSLFDRSGNANNLSVWTGNWHWYRPAVPAVTTPQTGAANTRSIQNAGGFPAISAIGTSLTNWSPAAWTIEATIRPDDATNGFQTFIGRDSLGAYAGDPALAALYFQITPTGALQVAFTDAAGNNWRVTSTANAIQDAKWHAVAATSDGDTLKLYRKNLTNGDATYTLLGTADLSASVNPALTPGTGDGGDWDAGVFTFTRGLFNGGHTDRFLGNLDDVRLSDGALAPAAFLYSIGSPPVPTGLAATGSTGQIHLTWTASTGATSYTVKRSTTPGGPYTTVVASGVTATSYSDSGLTAGSTFHYVVSAVNAAGESTHSAQASATVFTPGQAWRQTNFGTTANTGTAADDQDPDKDGVANLLERAFGGNPNASDVSILPAIDPTVPRLAIVYRKAIAATDLSFGVQEDTDLAGSWDPATGSSAVIGGDSNVQLVRFTRPAGTAKRLFLRVEVTGP